MSGLTWILVLLVLACGVQASDPRPIYRGNSGDGAPLYSDRQQAGEAVALPALTSVPATSVPAPAPAQSPAPSESAAGQLIIVSPSSGSYVAHSVSGVRVVAQRVGHSAASGRIGCLLNGQLVAYLGSDNSCWVVLPERGEQRLQVAFISNNQRQSAHSKPVLVYVQRHHLPPVVHPSQR